VRHALRTGRNLIAVLVHRDAPTGRIMRHEPGFAAYIDWSNEAKRQVIQTDAKWVCRPEMSIGPRDEAWSSIEEHIEGRKAVDLTDRKLSLAGWPASVPAGGLISSLCGRGPHLCNRRRCRRGTQIPRIFHKSRLTSSLA